MPTTLRPTPPPHLRTEVFDLVRQVLARLPAIELPDVPVLDGPAGVLPQRPAEARRRLSDEVPTKDDDVEDEDESDDEDDWDDEDDEDDDDEDDWDDEDDEDDWDEEDDDDEDDWDEEDDDEDDEDDWDEDDEEEPEAVPVTPAPARRRR